MDRYNYGLHKRIERLEKELRVQFLITLFLFSALVLLLALILR